MRSHPWHAFAQVQSGGMQGPRLAKKVEGGVVCPKETSTKSGCQGLAELETGLPDAQHHDRHEPPAGSHMRTIYHMALAMEQLRPGPGTRGRPDRG